MQNIKQEINQNDKFEKKAGSDTQKKEAGKAAWWMEEAGFFGDFYLDGDNSIEGYLEINPQLLEERTLTEVDGVINLLGLKEHSRILDLPCGYGRHSLELAKRGFDVVGSDLNTAFLKIAKQETDKNGISMEFHQENMLDIDYQQEFDALINMFYAFGFFDTEEENFQVLTNFYNALKPNGKFLFHTDVNIPRVLNGLYKHDETRSLRSGGELRIIDLYDEASKRINGAWIIKDQNGKVTRKDYSVRVYTDEEFIDLCRQAGFRNFWTYGDWSGNPYGVDTEDLIIIAEK